MNVKRIQTNFLKMMLNEESVYVLKEIFPHMVGITEGHVVYFIPDCEFFLDRSKMKEVDLSWIADKSSHSLPAERTGIEKKDNSCRGRTMVEVKQGDTSIWLDAKFVDDFDKFASFNATNDVSPVFVYECGMTVGVVLPIRNK